MFSERTEDLAQNKLLLLYLIDNSELQLKNSVLTDFMLRHDFMNYFSIQQYLSELIDGDFLNLIDENGSKFYTITETGQMALEYFQERIPEEFKKVVNEELTALPNSIYERDSKIIDIDDEIGVNLELSKNGEVILDLYLKLKDLDQASRIKENWDNNSDDLYIEILERLL